jgi:hypothetical protein
MSSNPRRNRNDGNAGALVVSDPNKGRKSQRRPAPQGQRRRGGPPQKGRTGEPEWQEPDDVSEVSDAEYEQDYEERKSAVYILER